jgi:hypothetical protein
MMDILGVAISGLLGLGAALLALALAGGLASLGRAVVRWRTPVWVRYLRQGAEEQKGRGTEKRAGREGMGWVLGGVVLGVLARDPILSPWFPALGLALARWQRGVARRRRAAQESTPHALALTRGVANFLRGAVGPALSDAAQRLPDGPVRERALRACRRYAAGTPWDEALRDLTGLNPLLDRLALLLAAAPRMGEAAVRKALDDLAREAAAREALEAETGAELVLLKLTVRFLLVANLVALAASLLVPAWHDFFTSTLARRGTVMAANLLVAGAYVYFSEEIAALREAI